MSSCMRHYQKWFVMLTAVSSSSQADVAEARRRATSLPELRMARPKPTQRLARRPTTRHPAAHRSPLPRLTSTGATAMFGDGATSSSIPMRTSSAFRKARLTSSTTRKSFARPRYPMMLFRGDGNRFPRNALGFYPRSSPKGDFPARQTRYLWSVDRRSGRRRTNCAASERPFGTLQLAEDDVLGPVKRRAKRSRFTTPRFAGYSSISLQHYRQWWLATSIACRRASPPLI